MVYARGRPGAGAITSQVGRPRAVPQSDASDASDPRRARHCAVCCTSAIVKEPAGLHPRDLDGRRRAEGAAAATLHYARSSRWYGSQGSGLRGGASACVRRCRLRMVRLPIPESSGASADAGCTALMCTSAGRAVRRRATLNQRRTGARLTATTAFTCVPLGRRAGARSGHGIARPGGCCAPRTGRRPGAIPRARTWRCGAGDRVDCTMRLNLKRRGPKRVLTRPRVALNHTWALDCMGDTLTTGAVTGRSTCWTQATARGWRSRSILRCRACAWSRCWTSWWP